MCSNSCIAVEVKSYWFRPTDVPNAHGLPKLKVMSPSAAAPLASVPDWIFCCTTVAKKPAPGATRSLPADASVEEDGELSPVTA